MTVNLHAEANGKLLILKLSGKLKKEDYAHFTPEVEQAVKKHGKIRMLVEMHDFHGWTLGAVWEDIKFDVHHYSHIERLAFVGDKKWEAGMATFCKPFTAATVRYFDETKSDAASLWIHEGVVSASQTTC
ncbi:STAS/SEC14 domain-containing protein [Novipirellula sp. SH528]|uniref:STAS/SEC14 domain-containing protein n=1 Tax=Novipirellula sp. SH528 TaxID=3454466 RepID=UPI003FA059D0